MATEIGNLSKPLIMVNGLLVHFHMNLGNISKFAKVSTLRLFHFKLGSY